MTGRPPNAPYISEQWKRELLGQPIAEAIRTKVPVVRHINVRVTVELARLTSRIARSKGLSREAWFRQILAEAVAKETPGMTPEDVARCLATGRRNVRPETRRA